MKQKHSFHGLTLKEASRLSGYPVVSLWRWQTGFCVMRAETALKISERLGIPLWNLRPDIWPMPEGAEKEISVTSRTCELGSGNPLSSVTRKSEAGELVEE